MNPSTTQDRLDHMIRKLKERCPQIHRLCLICSARHLSEHADIKQAVINVDRNEFEALAAFAQVGMMYFSSRLTREEFDSLELAAAVFEAAALTMKGK